MLHIKGGGDGWVDKINRLKLQRLSLNNRTPTRVLSHGRGQAPCESKLLATTPRCAAVPLISFLPIVQTKN